MTSVNTPQVPLWAPPVAIAKTLSLSRILPASTLSRVPPVSPENAELPSTAGT
jgi:hypothetical protein